jgi:hypothetical protein
MITEQYISQNISSFIDTWLMYNLDKHAAIYKIPYTENHEVKFKRPKFMVRYVMVIIGRLI